MENIPEEIGRHFIIGLNGPALSSEERHIISALNPLGIILRAPNFLSDAAYTEWRAALKKLHESVLALSTRSSIVVAIDHEGGRVHRTPAPLTHFPAARAYAEHAREVASAMAIELQSIGVNLSFAPVADIDSNPNNKVIGTRAFSTEAQVVAHASCEFARGLLAHAVVPVAKHFPGHGDTLEDSHEELPVVQHSIEALLSRELTPFRALVQANVPAILTAHILFPNIDENYPATLSPLVLHRLAREELGFEGVIISDDMDMKAIANNFSDEEVALRAIVAGCDVLLFNHDPARALRVATFLQSLLKQKDLDPDIFEISTRRVGSFLKTYIPIHEVRALSEETLSRHATLRDSLSAATLNA